MDRARVLEIMNGILAANGKAPVTDPQQTLREVGFRSLDFSEAALTVEDEVGRELNFQAVAIREIRTVEDVLSFFESILAAHEPA